MILVDTSVWIDHLGRGDIPGLVQLLEEGEVLCHPFVIAEIALGSPSDREQALKLLKALPAAPVAASEELMVLISGARLGGTGIGFVDAHLLAACRISRSMLWTRDKRLDAQAQRLGCAWPPS
jgi:predicted nucleic acid-binding protein